jgi:selenocysteine lyase/cysteine desulfurase
VGLTNVKNGIKNLTYSLLARLKTIDNVVVLGCSNHDHPRYGSVSFIVYDSKGREVHPLAVAAALSFFHGVQLRANHLCAPVYIHAMKGIDNRTANLIAHEMQKIVQDQSRDHALKKSRYLTTNPFGVPSLHAVRPSVGFGTTEQVIDKFILALKKVVENSQYNEVVGMRNVELGVHEYIPRGLSKKNLQRLTWPEIPDYKDHIE